MRIFHNLASQIAQRGLADATRRLAGNSYRLSTGLRINRAADDAAGLSMSERLRAQIRSLDQARRNAEDGVSLVQTAESALGEVSDMLVRLRELAVEGANGTLSATDRATIDDEFQALVAEVDRVGRSTSFNGIQLLDGSSSSVSFHVGPGTTAGVDTVSASLTPVLATGLGIDVLAVTDTAAASTAITALDTAIDEVARARGNFGAAQNRLQSTIRTLGVRSENLAAAESRIRDVDFAAETARLTRNSILQQAAIAVLAQANTAPELTLRLFGQDG